MRALYCAVMSEETTEQADETPSVEDQLADAKSEAAGLRALFGHLHPGVEDLDGELENMAFKRDGTPVYVGDLKPVGLEGDSETSGSEAPEALQDKPKRAVRRSPAVSRASSVRTPNLDNMTDEQRVEHYREVMQKEWR